MTVNLIRMFKQNMGTVKALPLLAAAISLAIAAGTIAPTLAQSTTPTAPTTTTHKHGGMWSKLNLSDDQKAQLKALHADTKTQINGVLTQAQQDQLTAAQGNWKQRRQAWKSLGLTSDQQASIKQIRSNAKQQLQTILTADQFQQLQQMRQHHKTKTPTTQTPAQ